MGVLHLYYGVSLKFQIIGTEQHNTENAMQDFINKYRDQINGTLSGFDRLVFRGTLRRLNYGYWDQNLQSVVAQGMEQYLWQNHILFKDYLDHVKQVSQKVKQASVKPFESQGLPVQFFGEQGRNRAGHCGPARSGKRMGMRPQQCGTQPVVRTSGHALGAPGETLSGAFTNTKSIRKWDGCMRASRLGSRSTFRWA